jgi:predicted CopG family antitoxin
MVELVEQVEAMTTDKTIKVSEEVHAELERRKRTSRADSFDTVLKQVLELMSTPDSDTLGAYFPLDEHREAAQAVIDHIRTLGTLDESVTSNPRYLGTSYTEGLEFESEESGRTIVAIGFQETTFTVYYRGPGNEFREVASVRHNRDEDTVEYDNWVSSSDYFDDDLSGVINAIDQKAAGALRRWS